MSEEKILSSFAGAMRQGSLKEKHHVPAVRVRPVSCLVWWRGGSETRRNRTDSTDNSQLREEEGKGGYKGVKLKGRQDLDQDLRVEYKRGGDMQSSVIWVGYSR